jgi:hypothetical protein
MAHASRLDEALQRSLARETNMASAADRDQRHHTQKMHKALQNIKNHLRKDIETVDEPQLKAMFETSAEVLGGLIKAFRDYEQKNESAWAKRPEASKFTPHTRYREMEPMGLSMTRETGTRAGIAVLIYSMVSGVLFGAGLIIVLTLPVLNANAGICISAVVGASFILEVPIAWWMAPRLRARYSRQTIAANHAPLVSSATRQF